MVEGKAAGTAVDTAVDTVLDMAMAMGMAADMTGSGEDCMADASAADSDFGTESSRLGSMGLQECMGHRS